MRLMRSLLTLTTILAACTTTKQIPKTSLKDLSSKDFDRAAAYLGSLDFLAWEDGGDGCHARALYYSMTLAVQGIGTNHVYAVALPNHSIGRGWDFHVAPLVTSTGQAFVLDPAFNRDRAILVSEWVDALRREDIDSVHVHSGNSYDAHTEVVNRIEDVKQPLIAKIEEPAVAAIGKFSLASINDACRVIHRANRFSRDPKTNKQKLIDESQRLVRELTRLGLIEFDIPTLTNDSCLEPKIPGGFPGG